MHFNPDHMLSRFCVAGISYRKADTNIRGQFAVDEPAVLKILKDAADHGLHSIFVLSTCNRTEIYGYVQHPYELVWILSRHVRGSVEDFLHHGFHFTGRDALHHLFRVSAGLDSQIIGDYEIQGQLKAAINLSRKQGLIGPVMDRTINFVFQAAKKIRTSTLLSTGTVSVSFAAIEWLHRQTSGAKVQTLVLGTGKFGTSVCKSLLQYLPEAELTVCNRTNEKARQLSVELNVRYLPFEELAHNADAYDAIIVSTSANQPVLLNRYLRSNKRRFVVDLSVPANVESTIAERPGTTLVNVDDISEQLKRTVDKRMQEVPKAESIIAAYEAEFYQWLHTYRHSHAVKHMKEQLHGLLQGDVSACEMASPPVHADADALVQQTINDLMVNLRSQVAKGCQFINAYRYFLEHPAVVLQQS